MVAGGKQCASGSTITSNKTCSANLYRCNKRSVGCLLRRAHCKRHLDPSGKQAAYKLPRTESGPFGPEEFQDFCSDNIVLVATDNTTVVSYINKEGGTRSVHLCALLWRILTWCTTREATLKARHIPGWLNVVPDKLSRLGQTIQTELSLLPEIFSINMQQVAQASDLFATRFNNKLPRIVSPVPDPLASAVDALNLPWEDLNAYAYALMPFLFTYFSVP